HLSPGRDVVGDGAVDDARLGAAVDAHRAVEDRRVAAHGGVEHHELTGFQVDGGVLRRHVAGDGRLEDPHGGLTGVDATALVAGGVARHGGLHEVEATDVHLDASTPDAVAS